MTGARWSDADARWVVETDEATILARFLISATGALHTPNAPPFDGIDGFDGKVIHTSQWPVGYDGASERIALIGTGASSIQVTPELQKTAEHLTVFQRTPAWLLPKPDVELPAPLRRLFRRFPFTLELLRVLEYSVVELQLRAITNAGLTKMLTAVAKWHLNRSVTDVDLRERLTPDYILGCKRTLLSSDFYPALQQDNVDLVASPVSGVTATSVVAANGARRVVDTIVLANGFQFGLGPIASVIVGCRHRSLAQAWQGSPRAYKGTTVPGFPNLAIMWGPNLGTGSQFLAAEAQAGYVVDMIRQAHHRKLRSLEVHASALNSFVLRCDEHTARSTQNSGCHGYYLDENGRNQTLWPGSMSSMRREMVRFDIERYDQIAITEKPVSQIPSAAQ
jgi:cation diffusion facilitator CzcD-associated flavoprotein CzcO